MKKFLRLLISYVLIFVALFFISSVVFAADISLTADEKIPGKPFEELWAAVKALQVKVSDLQNQLNNIQLTPGPQGVQGKQGFQGISGSDGLSGINCWDLNSNRINDLEEDFNKDGILSKMRFCVSSEEEKYGLS